MVIVKNVVELEKEGETEVLATEERVTNEEVLIDMLADAVSVDVEAGPDAAAIDEDAIEDVKVIGMLTGDVELDVATKCCCCSHLS